MRSLVVANAMRNITTHNAEKMPMVHWYPLALSPCAEVTYHRHCQAAYDEAR